jgi:hypothetical protein
MPEHLMPSTLSLTLVHVTLLALPTTALVVMHVQATSSYG